MSLGQIEHQHSSNEAYNQDPSFIFLLFGWLRLRRGVLRDSRASAHPAVKLVVIAMDAGSLAFGVGAIPVFRNALAAFNAKHRVRLKRRAAVGTRRQHAKHLLDRHFGHIQIWRGSFLPWNLGKKPKSLRMRKQRTFSSHKIDLWIRSHSPCHQIMLASERNVCVAARLWRRRATLANDEKIPKLYAR
jgi:hypothetical protein